MFGRPQLLFDNRFADAQPVASSTAVGYNVANLADWRPYTWWQPDSLPATVTVDSGAPAAADYLVVYGHNMGTHGATLELRGSTDNFAASDDMIASISPADDLPFLVQFASSLYRYRRLRITGATAPSLAIAAAGSALELPRHLPTGFDPLGRKMHGVSNRSMKGHPLGQVFEFEEWSEAIQQRSVEQGWVRNTFLPAWLSHLRSTPFVFVWEPAEHADELYLVSSSGEFKAPHRGGQFCDLSFEVTGVHS